MKTDFSRLLYDKYLGLTCRSIEVKLKNGTVHQGVIIGFYKSGDESDKPYISKWHLVDEKEKNTLGINDFGFLTGQIIEQNNIAEVKFFEDNTVLRFE